MGDRIKFGPLWLRNYSREAGAGGGPGSTPSVPPGRAGAPANPAATTSSAPSTSNNSNQQQKSTIQLAKMRYGREEMLALYEKSIEAPNELKQFELLYNTREKPPIALNAYEDDGRGGGGAPIAPAPSGDRYAGAGRGATPPEMRGRLRNFVRPTAGRNPDGGPFERERPGEEGPYDPTRERNYSRRWQSTQHSWRRQAMREETDEWRAAESARPRSMHPERDWGERGGDRAERGERGGRESKAWNNNRRTWVGDTPSHDDLPEWAEDSNLACGGTFDASGAFHGYSNDDTNIPIPKAPQGDSAYQLIRSHTQGSFTRAKTAEEGTDEWWASEKAKKLSPKKFDANELKFKKQLSVPGTSTSSASELKRPETPPRKEASPPQEPPPAQAAPPAQPSQPASRFPKPDPEEKQRFDMMMKRMETMRPEFKKEASEERGNFKSVMINANNSLRQKHQNLVPVPVPVPVPVVEESARMQNIPMAHATKTPMPISEQARPDKKPKNLDQLDSLSLSELTLNDIEFEDYFEPPESASSGQSNSSVTSLNALLNINPNAPPSASMQQQMGRMPMPERQTPVSQQGGMSSRAMGMPGMRLGLETPRHMQPRKPLPYSPRMLYTGQHSPGAPAAAAAAAAREAPVPAGGGSAFASPMGPRLASSLFMGPEGSIPMPGDIQSQPPPSSQASMFPGQGLQSAWRDDKIPMPGEMQGIQSQMHSQPPPSSQSNMYTGQGMSPQPQPQQQSQSQQQQMQQPPPFGSSMYSSMLQQPPLPLPLPLPMPPGIADMWYYEDPKQITQGPFSSKEMYNWYRAGFFTSELMVRRACDLHMRPLGSYGSSVPFAPPVPDVPYQMQRSGFPGGHPDMHRFGLGDVESLWSQPAAPGAGDMWMPQQQQQPQQQQSQQSQQQPNDPRLMFFWDQQSTGGTTSTILPDGKEMKTEDQILAQLRASQEAENAAFLNKEASKPDATLLTQQAPTPDLGELEKFIQKEALSPKSEAPSSVQPTPENSKSGSSEDSSSNNLSAKQQQSSQLKAAAEKLPKIPKVEEKPKSKENGTTKSKKKNKDEKKDEAADLKNDDDSNKSGRKSEDTSPSKSKKEDKLSKKDLEKEKKEWLKEGFTIVKGSEKSNNKESKKKAEENKTVEEAERKRKEEEKLAAEEEKKRKQVEALKKQQEQQAQQSQAARQALEAVAKKAPWSAVAAPGPQGPSHDGLSLAEIQRLEREKKLEQMKEQQAMMQLIAQQQAAAFAREQEMQAGLGWAKKKNANTNTPGQSLAEIQAEARKQAAAAAAAAAAAQAMEEALVPPPPVTFSLPWGSSHNGGGFWDTERTSQIVQKAAEKPQPEAPKPEPKPKKKPAPAPAPVHVPKKAASPAHEFEAWCNSFLAVFSSKIDVPTFVGFLKDIESPFEVKEYVKCYLGESKDSNDFARQFLERRSKLLRAGTVTPVDDLCSPAAAINPRMAAGLDFQEGKVKKTKKNKMLKIDARILGFSVTASEDRINVGDIDSV